VDAGDVVPGLDGSRGGDGRVDSAAHGSQYSQFHASNHNRARVARGLSERD
jgi:hypothetical protein